jgi:hypothetical protein
VKVIRALPPAVAAHQGGWDELLMIGAPVVLFVVLRWLGLRKERREGAEQDTKSGE